MCPLGLRPETNNTGRAINAVCSGRGRCMSLRQASLYQDFVQNLGSDEYTDWDADRIYGCVCEPGFEGPNCARTSCPKGDDPNTESKPEIQLLDCRCTTCSGGLVLSYQGQVTPLIPFDAADGLVQYRLRQLPGLGNVVVTRLVGNKLCSSTGSVMEVLYYALSSVVTAELLLLLRRCVSR